jgi:hypothetical protein
MAGVIIRKHDSVLKNKIKVECLVDRTLNPD